MSCARIGAMLGAAMLATPAARAAAAAPPRPNIVFVLFDDLGYGEPPSFRADSPFRTPALDALARDGMRFTDAHSAAAVCTPTRYGVLTGRYPWRIGQYGVLQTYSAPIIPPSRPTVASLLRAQGYRTACFGKWHLGLRYADGKPDGGRGKPPTGARIAEGPLQLGFDRFSGYTHAGNIGMIIEDDRVATNLPPVEVQPFLARQAVAWLGDRARSRDPFFLYFPLCTPHEPHVPSSDFRGRSGQKDYGDWIMQGDDVVRQLREALDRAGLASNTLLLVSSDNGAEHRAYPPLRGSKRDIWEGGHRVPFYAYWPGTVAAGASSGQTLCLNDLLATAAELAGVAVPPEAGEDSVSFAPALRGVAEAPLREATVHQSAGGALAIRQGDWKLVVSKQGAPRQLFNLRDDLGEQTDARKTHPEIAQRLESLLQRYVEQGRSTPGPPQPAGARVPALEGKKEKKK